MVRRDAAINRMEDLNVQACEEANECSAGNASCRCKSGSFLEVDTVTHFLAAVNPAAYQVMTFLRTLAVSIGAIFSIALVVWLVTIVAL